MYVGYDTAVRADVAGYHRHCVEGAFLDDVVSLPMQDALAGLADAGRCRDEV